MNLYLLERYINSYLLNTVTYTVILKTNMNTIPLIPV